MKTVTQSAIRYALGFCTPLAFFCSNAVPAMPVETTSPYANVPLNLEGATFVPPNVMLLLDISGSMCYYTDNRTGTDCAYLNSTPSQITGDPNRKISIATNVAKDLFRNNTNVRWGFSVFSSSGGRAGTFNNIVVPIGDYSASHLNTLLDRADYWWANAWGQTYMYEAYNKAVNYYANQYASTSGYGSPVQYRCQKNNLILVGDGAPTDTPLSSMTALGTVNPRTFAEMSRMAYEGNLGLTGNDLDGKPFSSGDYPRQYMSTYTVGFAINLAIFKQAAEAGGGMYFTASDSDALTEALQTSLNDIVSKTSSTPAPVSVMQPTTGTIQLGFSTEDWSGSIKTYAVDLNGNISSTATEAVVPTDRMIFTSYGAGAARTFTKIDPSNSTLKADTTTFGANPEWTLRFLSGEEPSSETTWRKRNGKLLGDFVHTEAVSLNNGNDFAAGSNDGLLHYFRRNNSNHPYSELFAYAPSATLGKVQHVASRTYGQSTNPHRYLVDGAIVTQDLNMGSGSDKTILVGTLGRGGKGIYALDLSKATANNPNGIATNVGLWDYNAEDDTAYLGFRGSNLGYTFGRPVIAKVKQPGASRWMVIAGNGYDSTSAHASMTNRSSIYFLDAATKTMMGNVLIPTSGSNPGIGGIAVMDKDNDGVADIIYASDRNGDIWRIDLEEELHGTNADDSKNTKVYKLWSGSPNQPITMNPTLYRINTHEVMVLFGTGSMLVDSDKTSKTQQSVYGIRDNISAPPTTYSYSSDRGSSGRLIEQTIIEEKSVSGETYRKVTQNAKPADGSKSGGWYLDLKADGESAERITQPMMVLSNGVFFSTQIPTTEEIDTCNSGGGDGWIMALSAVTGSAPLKAVWSPASVDFSSGASTIAGFKSNTMGMPSALGLNTTSSTTSDWSSYSSLSGMITNQMNYLGTGLLAGMNITYSDQDGNLKTRSLLADNSVMQGYRTAWREII